MNDSIKKVDMKRRIYLLGIISCLTIQLQAQKYITKEGVIDIFSQTSLFTIEARNQTVASILDIENGEVVASTLIRSFKFREALVEEHFNENYMQSDQYPKSYFKGKITNYTQVDFTKDGTYDITIEGDLTIHGQTRPLKTNGKLTIKSGKIRASTEFDVSLENYKIKIEEQYMDRIKDDIHLVVRFDYNTKL
jgi:hypothetical protein